MTLNEAKMKIAKEFIDKYLEWLSDYNNDEVTDKEYGKKYGWGKVKLDGTVEHRKDTQKSLLWFQSHIFRGRYINNWSVVGIDKYMVHELHRDGFLSYDYCSSYKARMLGKCDFYYMNQNKAKEIYKAYKSGFFE